MEWIRRQMVMNNVVIDDKAPVKAEEMQEYEQLSFDDFFIPLMRKTRFMPGLFVHRIPNLFLFAKLILMHGQGNFSFTVDFTPHLVINI